MLSGHSLAVRASQLGRVPCAGPKLTLSGQSRRREWGTDKPVQGVCLVPVPSGLCQAPQNRSRCTAGCDVKLSLSLRIHDFKFHCFWLGFQAWLF
jgi:hypothetical protein